MSSKMVKPARRRWKPTPGAKLGPQEEKIMHFFAAHKIQAQIGALFVAITGMKFNRAVQKYTARQRQQRVGAVISRLNKKLRGRRVVAGTVPHTYRLRRVR